MRIALTNTHAWPEVRRGSESLLQTLGTWLGGRGHDVRVIAGASRRRAYEIDGLRYRTVPGTRALARVHRDLDEVTTALPGLARAIRAAAPDVVHALHFVDATAADLARRPYLVFYGGIALPESFRGYPLRRRLFRHASAHAGAVVCPSLAVQTHLRDAYGIRADVIPNGIDSSSFAERVARETDVVLCPATADDHRKRVEVLVRAFASLVHAGADVRLVLAGAASENTRRRLAGAAGAAAGRIEFAGTLDDHELRRRYAGAAVTCLPSLNEAFGLVLIESLASGTPVVGADHGAIPEIVTPGTGLTFPADDADRCADALRTVMGWWEHDTDLEQRCRDRAGDFDWDRIGPLYEALYARVA